MDASRTLIMACATVIEEMLPHLPKGMNHQVFDFGLHVNPAALRSTLQEAIDAVNGRFDTIILGYGLCSQAIIGIKATGCQLVVPRVDDCISIFLGSHASYKLQSRQEPGTYYLTKGWIEVGDTPFTEHERMVERFGPDRAERITRLMLKHYTRLALINTGQYEMDRYRRYTRDTAQRFGLRFEEIQGSDSLIQKMIHGPWDSEFVILQPGETFTLGHFFTE